jgi:hypothetical protein
MLDSYRRSLAAAAPRRTILQMATPQERADQKRKEKLKLIRDQVESGELKIREMTKAERAKNPPRSRPEKKRGRG